MLSEYLFYEIKLIIVFKKEIKVLDRDIYLREGKSKYTCLSANYLIESLAVSLITTKNSCRTAFLLLGNR